MAACVFDSTFMLLLTDDLAPAPAPPATEKLSGLHARDRVYFLLETLDDERIDVVLPTPVLTELLASARADVAATLSVLMGLSRIRVEGFGPRAAIECAEMLRRTGRGQGPRSKVKFDHQIVAIAKVISATRLYSDDLGVRTLCDREGLECRGVWQLPQRPVDPQSKLPL